MTTSSSPRGLRDNPVIKQVVSEISAQGPETVDEFLAMWHAGREEKDAIEQLVTLGFLADGGDTSIGSPESVARAVVSELESQYTPSAH